MSTMESRKGPRRRLTFSDLLAAAQSRDAVQRKQAYMAFVAWKRVGAEVPASDRLTWMQCEVLTKIFMDKGFIKPGNIKSGAVDARTRAP